MRQAPAETTPPPGTVERWAYDLVLGVALAEKLRPPAPPPTWEEDAPPRRLAGPGRPAELERATRSGRTPRALERPEARARLVHTFLHHELQAAELFAWALLAFPETPTGFRRGLLAAALDELRHLRLYRAHLGELGFEFGAFPVRDWFWERVPTCTTPTQFCALVGLGLEGANLDHTARFARAFRAAGDEQGARLLERVGREEVAHVRFGRTWFGHFAGDCEFATWLAELPAPLTPGILRGRPLQREARRRAGLAESFVDELEAWEPAEPPRGA